MKNRRVMVIGLDGATFNLIKPWVKEGKLPTFKKLMQKGVYGNLKSTIPWATIPAWPSFATGCNPGKHGFYDFFKEKKDSYDLTVELQPSKAVKQPTLWEILSWHKKKVAVINVPATYPPTKINGYMVTGMFTPSGAKFTYPPEFEEEIRKKIGRYNVFFSSLSSKNPESLLEDLMDTLDQRVRLVKYLWDEKSPDFLMMVDNGTDRAEHELWKFIDPMNPLYNPRNVEKYGNPLLKYYQYVDQKLQEILNLLDEETILIVMSDHGQSSLRKFVNLNLFLIEEGFMVIKSKIFSKLKFFLFNHGLTPSNLYRFLKKIGIERLATDRVSPAKRLLILNRFFFSTSDIEWSKTKAFASGVTGAITLNVKGRQPMGIVNPGTEYENIREEIINKLSELKDPETGDYVVRKVYKREEIYEGPYLNQAPDIIATPNDYYEFFGMHGFSFNKVIDYTFANSGEHTLNGIFIAVGEGIKRGVEIEGANIIDLAPTILHIMNLPIPIHMDGKVLKEIFEEDSEFYLREYRYTSNLNKEKEKIKKAMDALKK